MKKLILVALLAAASTTAIAYDGTTLESYDSPGDLLSHCAGVFVANSSVAKALKNEKYQQQSMAMASFAVQLATQADSTNSEAQQQIARDAAGMYKAAVGGDMSAVDQLQSDTKSCMVLLDKLLK